MFLIHPPLSFRSSSSFALLSLKITRHTLLVGAVAGDVTLLIALVARLRAAAEATTAAATTATGRPALWALAAHVALLATVEASATSTTASGTTAATTAAATTAAAGIRAVAAQVAGLTAVVARAVARCAHSALSTGSSAVAAHVTGLTAVVARAVAGGAHGALGAGSSAFAAHVALLAAVVARARRLGVGAVARQVAGLVALEAGLDGHRWMWRDSLSLNEHEKSGNSKRNQMQRCQFKQFIVSIWVNNIPHTVDYC